MERQQENFKKTTRQAQGLNWTLVIVAWIFIAMVTLFIYAYRALPDAPEERYCYFQRDLANDSLPRHECGIIKIITTEMDTVMFDKLMATDTKPICVESPIEDYCISKKDTRFGFVEFPLNVFCTTENCSVTGKICAGYYIDYYDNSSLRVLYEDDMFETRMINEPSLLRQLKECDVDG